VKWHKIVSSPQAKAYDGVKHSVSQKDTDLRGEAHRQPKLILVKSKPIAFYAINPGANPGITKQKTSPVTSQKRLNP
jgi:hypothetical protein